MGFYVTEKNLKALDKYKYVGNDRSILAPYFQYWWRFAVNYLPEWLAPNTVTLIGLFFMIASYFVNVYYCPNVKGIAPAWTYLFHAFCVFMYQTLDALDGKQARKTYSSSPLGELFDHGCDALTTSFLAIVTTSTMQFGTNGYLLFFFLNSLTVFFFAQWEEYYTGVMELGVINVTEIQVFCFFIQLSAFFLGPLWWTTRITILGFSLEYKDFVVLFGVVSTIGTLFNNFRSVAHSISTDKLNPVKVFSKLTPIIVTVVSATVWFLNTNGKVLSNDPQFFLLSIGFLFATLVGKIVYYRICGKKEIETLPYLVIPLLVGAISSFSFARPIVSKIPILNDDLLYVRIYCFITLFGYLHLAHAVIEDLTTYLKIKCFRIPRIVEVKATDYNNQTALNKAKERMNEFKSSNTWHKVVVIEQDKEPLGEKKILDFLGVKK